MLLGGCGEDAGSVAMSVEYLSRYVLVPAALLAVVLYFGMIISGLAEFVTRAPKRKNRRRSSGRGTAGHSRSIGKSS